MSLALENAIADMSAILQSLADDERELAAALAERQAEADAAQTALADAYLRANPTVTAPLAVVVATLRAAAAQRLDLAAIMPQ